MSGYVGTPMSYTPVEYIESSGTQYIDTGFIPTANTKLEFDAIIVSGDTNVWMPVWGSRSYTASNPVPATYFCLYIQTNSHHLSPNYAGFDPGTGGNTTINFNQRYKLTEDRGQFYIDDVLKSGISTTNTLTTGDKTLYLFTNNSVGQVQLRGQDVRLYGCKIWDNDVLVRNFIPVVDQDNVACLYDLVEGKFYYNKGLGTFVAGNATGQPVSIGDRAREITKAYVGVPASYTPVEYIESSGTQYIDTGYSANNNTKVVAEISNFPPTGATWAGAFGARNSSLTDRYCFFKTNDNIYRSDFGVANESFPSGLDLTSRTIITKDKNVTTIGQYTVTGATATFTATYTMWIFAVHDQNGANAPTSLRLYSFKIYDNDTLVRDFIPALDDNSVACLYDQVEGKFYYNKGLGTFTAGSAIGQPVSIGSKARKIVKGYVGINGVARLCFEGNYMPRYKSAFIDTIHVYNPMLTNTDNYILVAGGTSSSGANPIKTVTAYNSSLVSTATSDMPSQAHLGTATNFYGYGIVAGGKTAWSGNSRTSQCMVYNDNLTRTDLTALYTSVFETSSAANSVHCIIEGGCYYADDTSSAYSYDINFVKTSLTNMSGSRRSNSAATVGDYIVCMGACKHSTSIATDFYDNSNVKTTGTAPYNKYNWNPLGLSTKSYAIFFGGATSQGNLSTAYADCKAYDKNKVLTTFSLPSAVTGAGGFSDDDYAMCCLAGNAYIYDDNLVLKETLTGTFGGISYGKTSARTDSFGIVHSENTSNYNVFDF